MNEPTIIPPENAERERLWAIEDVAAHLGVSVPTVRNYIHKRNLPAKRIGKAFRFQPDEIDAWVQEQAA